MKTILNYHNIPFHGTKDQLVLNVCLLRSVRRQVINQEKRAALLHLIKIVKCLISKQIALEAVNINPHKRKYESNDVPCVSSKKPQATASECLTYIKSRILVPSGISKHDIVEMLQPIKEDIVASNRVGEENNSTSENNEFVAIKPSIVPERNDGEMYEQYF